MTSTQLDKVASDIDSLDLSDPLQVRVKEAITETLAAKNSSLKTGGFTSKPSKDDLKVLKNGTSDVDALRVGIQQQPGATDSLKMTLIAQHRVKQLTEKDYKTLKKARDVALKAGLITDKVHARLEALAQSAKIVKDYESDYTSSEPKFEQPNGKGSKKR